jgi:hypothetical protein
MGWLEQYEKTVKQESGGGIIGKATIGFGYRAFVTGDQEKSWFPLENWSDEEKEAKKAAATQLASSEEARMDFGVQIKMHVDASAVRGEPAGWKSDRFFFYAGYTDGAEIVKNSLVEHNIDPNPQWTGFVRLAFQDDPYAVAKGEDGKKEGKDGVMRFPQVAYVVKRYDSMQAAMRAAGIDDASAESMDEGEGDEYPPDWDLETWMNEIPYIKKRKEGGESLAKIAEDYGVGVRWIKDVNK